MKTVLYTFLLLTSICYVIYQTTSKELISSTHSGRGCSGSEYCSACKNCSGCKYCAKNGGTCGVCAPTNKKKTISKKPKK